MAEELFDAAAGRLELETDLDRLEARGTVRIALKEGGLEAKNLTFPQLTVVFERIMPQLLEARAVGDPASVCSAVMNALEDSARESASSQTSSDEIFGRLGGH